MTIIQISTSVLAIVVVIIIIILPIIIVITVIIIMTITDIRTISLIAVVGAMADITTATEIRTISHGLIILTRRMILVLITTAMKGQATIGTLTKIRILRMIHHLRMPTHPTSHQLMQLYRVQPGRVPGFNKRHSC